MSDFYTDIINYVNNTMTENEIVQKIHNNEYNLNLNINTPTEQNATPLMIAIKKNAPLVARKLISTGESRPDHLDSDNNTALIYACMYNKYDLIRPLLATGKSLPEQMNFDDKNALSLLCDDYSTNLLFNRNLKQPQLINAIKAIHNMDSKNPSYQNNPDILNVLSDINTKIYNKNQIAESATKLALPYASSVMKLRSANGNYPQIPSNKQTLYGVASNDDITRHIYSYLKEPRIQTPKGGRMRRKRRTTTRHRKRRCSYKRRRQPKG